jgi:hypothetical protein
MNIFNRVKAKKVGKSVTYGAILFDLFFFTIDLVCYYFMGHAN